MSSRIRLPDVKQRQKQGGFILNLNIPVADLEVQAKFASKARPIDETLKKLGSGIRFDADNNSIVIEDFDIQFDIGEHYVYVTAQGEGVKFEFLGVFDVIPWWENYKDYE